MHEITLTREAIHRLEYSQCEDILSAIDQTTVKSILEANEIPLEVLEIIQLWCKERMDVYNIIKYYLDATLVDGRPIPSTYIEDKCKSLYDVCEETSKGIEVFGIRFSVRNPPSVWYKTSDELLNSALALKSRGHPDVAFLEPIPLPEDAKKKLDEQIPANEPLNDSNDVLEYLEMLREKGIKLLDS